VKKKKSHLIIVIIEVAMLFLGTWAMMQDVVFLITKKEALAHVIRKEKLPLPDPYRITFKYYNSYEKQYITTYIDNIDGRYGKELPGPGNFLKIYYKKFLPKVVYLEDYKFPNGGYLFVIATT
jgi:hypothetical protein